MPVPPAAVVKKPQFHRLALLSLPVIALAIGAAYLYWQQGASHPALTSAAAPDSADDRAWSNAASLGTIQALKQYLDGFPKGGHVAEAQQRIRATDDKAWEDAFGAGTIVALNKYLAQFPEGAHSSQAQRSIAGLERQVAEQNHSSDRTHFDGSWVMTISCETAAGAQGYSIQTPAQVKNGVFHGQRASEGQPNWVTVDGTIQLDGSAELFVQGVTTAAAYTVGNLPAGSNYAYHIVARFEDASGTGRRQELRPCTFTAVKH
jgi:hypothetical protein